MQRLVKIFLAALLIGIFASPEIAGSQSLDVPIYDTHRPPTVVIDGDIITGIYPELFREALIRAGINFNFVKVPQRRKRFQFADGKYVLSCCSNPGWRTQPLETAVQLFSSPLTVTRDIFVHAFLPDPPNYRCRQIGRSGPVYRRGFQDKK